MRGRFVSVPGDPHGSRGRMMQCPACQAENLDEATACSTCGTSLAQRPSRRIRRSREDFSAGESPADKRGLAWTAYRWSVVGLIPLIGLFCGPVAFVLGLWAWVGG